MYLEVIVTDALEAAVAEASGANRVELVRAPERGGLSPDADTVRRVVEAVRIPVHAMVRVHDRSFQYDAAEREEMVAEARRFAAAGVGAIVFGALTAQGTVDREALSAIADATGEKEITFHRAFDVAADLLAAYEDLAHFSAVTRVLTSGASSSAWGGRNLLRQMTALRSHPIVLAAGGITSENVGSVVQATGVHEVHVGLGARTGAQLDEGKIQALATALRQVHRTKSGPSGPP